MRRALIALGWIAGFAGLAQPSLAAVPGQQEIIETVRALI